MHWSVNVKQPLWEPVGIPDHWVNTYSCKQLNEKEIKKDTVGRYVEIDQPGWLAHSMQMNK